jgi:filamentous hemagglutinin family protein
MKAPYIRFSIVAIACSLISVAPLQAQVIGDKTLPINTIINNQGTTFNITGGTQVGGNQFHSFQQFSVPTGNTAYFNNGNDVTNIISRVTGNSISNIDGLIKANGQANLFLINPNGIIFGKNAQLQIGGSFTASTANSIKFTDGKEFSATNPQSTSLLTVSAPIGLQYGKEHNAVISNDGNLSVNKDLTLSSGNVISNGTLSALQGNLRVESVTGDVEVKDAIANTATFTANRNLILNSSQIGTISDLSLLAKDSVIARDTAERPFIASSGAKLTVQGDRLIDLFVLNHSDSGFYSDSDMVFRSANTIIGDAHYYTNGNFRIEKLDGKVGNLQSPVDPIIRSLGDVTFGVYLGQSLHIIAGGSVTIDTVGITSADNSNIANSINPTSNPDLASVTLSNGDVKVINGNTQPTLDIRAGVSSTAIASTGIVGNTNISRFRCSLSPANCFYNNDPGRTVASSRPSTTQQLTSNSSAAITIGNIAIASPNGVVLLTNNYAPNLDLDGDITVTGEGLFRRNPSFQFKPNVQAGIDIASDTGNGGSLYIDSRRNITFKDNQLILTGSSFPSGKGGDINLLAKNNVDFGNNVLISANAAKLGGNIKIISGGDILGRGLNISSLSIPTATNSGNIDIKGASLSLLNSLISATTNGLGNAGTIKIDIADKASFDRSFVSVSVSQNGQGNAGLLEVNAKDISIVNGSQLSSGVTGKGNGGLVKITTENLKIDGTGTIQIINNANAISNVNVLSGIFASVNEGAVGNGGSIDITAQDISISNNGRISSSTKSTGNAGTIKVTAENLDISSGGKIRTETLSSGNAGKIDIIVSNRLSLTGNGSDILASSDVNSTGVGGTIFIDPAIVTLSDGAKISVSSLGKGDGGDITLIAGLLSLNRSSIIAETSNGKGGNLTLKIADILWLRNASLISATAGSNGNGGNIDLSAKFILAFSTENSDIFANAFKGNGGNINITTQGIFGLEFRDRPTPLSDITASSTFGLNGTVLINTPGVDPSKGLGTLPADLSDVSSLLSQRCSSDKVENKFFITGRGGLPPSPSDPIYRTVQLLSNLGSLSSGTLTMNSKQQSPDPSLISDSERQFISLDRIVEAQGWVTDKMGQVSLISKVSEVSNPIWSNQPHCLLIR